MPKYHVHVYPVFRVRVPDVEADSQEEACEKAEQAVNFAQFDQLGFEYADGVDGFLVDTEQEFLEAMGRVAELDRQAIQQRAEATWGIAQTVDRALPLLQEVARGLKWP
mgnify:CR=1 FL=1